MLKTNLTKTQPAQTNNGTQKDRSDYVIYSCVVVIVDEGGREINYNDVRLAKRHCSSLSDMCPPPVVSSSSHPL